MLVSLAVRGGLPANLAIARPRAGRFELEALLGMGAAGEVYRAHDPRLDRAVALKIVRADRDRPEARSRLLAEARAQAQVNHPNVVVVYEAGELDDDVYLAMPLDRAESLRVFLSRRRATGPVSAWWIAELFAQAARGLAAVHAVGLVHRDIKPDNLLVGADGVVRVADFGLAKRPVSANSLTSTAGTPSYMAPEQHARETLDGRADQYSLCVALWEALFCELPFAASDRRPLVDAKRQGPPPRPPRRPRLPGPLAAVLTRGLAPQATNRYPDAQALALALTRPTRMRSGAALAAALGVCVVAFAALRPGRARLEPAAACVAALAIDRVAASPGRLAFSTRLRGSGTASSIQHVEANLARTLTALSAQATQACRATHVAHTQSPALLDARVACLTRQRDDLVALLELFARADGLDLWRAGDALADVADPGQCTDAAGLDQMDPPPTEAARRQKLDQLSRGLAAVRALSLASRAREVVELGGRLLPELREFGYRPLLAELLSVLGDARMKIDDRAGAATDLREALALADASRADRLRGTVALTLCGFLSEDPAHIDEAIAFADQAAAASARLGGDATVDALRLEALGMVYFKNGRYAEAVVMLRQAVSRARALWGDGASVADFMSNLGAALATSGALAEARTVLEQSVALREVAQGADHPDVGIALVSLAPLVANAGDGLGAIAMLERARALLARAYGPRSVSVAGVLSSLAAVESGMERDAEALAYGREALAVLEERLVPGDANLAMARVRVAESLLNLGRFAEAEPLVSQARAAQEAALGLEHVALARAVFLAGVIALERGHPAEAAPLLARAAAMQERSGATPSARADGEESLAYALWASGRHAEATSQLQRACAMAAAAGDFGEVKRRQLNAWARTHRTAGCPKPDSHR